MVAVKCLWNLLCNAIFFGLIIVIILIFCQIKGIPFDMHINTEMQTVLFEPECGYRTCKRCIYAIWRARFGISVVSNNMSASDVALFVVQACIQFYDYVYDDACVSVFSECFLIGNYAMLIRHSWINVDGMDCSIGIPCYVCSNCGYCNCWIYAL